MAENSPLLDAILHRTPQQLFTQGYLDDPIQFTSDIRVVPELLVKQENLYAVVERDQADFAKLNLAATGSVFYPVPTITPLYDRKKFKQQLLTSIKSF
jgi:hypothetical protein